MKPEISVCLTFYNAELYIEEAIASILEQSFEDFELIIINDGSTDNSETIVSGFDDKRIRYFKSNHNYIQSLNIGLTNATGKYIARMDADDKSHKDRLLIQYNYLENNPDITACGTGMEIFGRSPDRYIPYYLNPEEIEIAFLEFNCFTIALIRHDFLRKHNIRYNADFIYAEDYKLYTDIIIAGGKLVNIPQVLYYYRQHEQQVTSKKREQITENSLKNQKELINYLIKRDKNEYKEIMEIHFILEQLYIQEKISMDDYCKVMRVLIKSQK